MRESLRHIQSILITSGYPAEKHSKILGEAISSVQETSSERARRERFTKDVPATSEADKLRKQYLRQLELKGR